MVRSYNVVKRVLYDIRDNNSYTVRKMADGNCWMMENLTLPVTADTPITVSSNTALETFSYTPTSCSTNEDCAMNGNTVVTNGTYYYSWYLTTAGTGKITDGQGVETTASICPVGWRVPANYTVNTARSYSTLTNAYGFTSNGANSSTNNTAKLEAYPFDFARLGMYDSATLYHNGIYAYYWSSTASPDTPSYGSSAYFFEYDARSGGTSPQHYHPKRYGFPVRCIAL